MKEENDEAGGIIGNEIESWSKTPRRRESSAIGDASERKYHGSRGRSNILLWCKTAQQSYVHIHETF
ncbi:Myosin-1 [Fusarium oxysporum f. sp. albedinis]|nr:Myosin-1 [Fusarium oxysporum f. sp. albedinis]